MTLREYGLTLTSAVLLSACATVSGTDARVLKPSTLDETHCQIRLDHSKPIPEVKETHFMLLCDTDGNGEIDVIQNRFMVEYGNTVREIKHPHCTNGVYFREDDPELGC